MSSVDVVSEPVDVPVVSSAVVVGEPVVVSVSSEPVEVDVVPLDIAVVGPAVVGSVDDDDDVGPERSVSPPASSSGLKQPLKTRAHAQAVQLVLTRSGLRRGLRIRLLRSRCSCTVAV